MQAFEYANPTTVKEAVGLLGSVGEKRTSWPAAPTC